jgi:TetR/AcrR family transcriptional regulator, transcriptional repressor for nem operon
VNTQHSAESTDTRQRILRTAFQLFHEQGFHATGVATIVREAGVNPGSLYHFFESKDDLLLGVLEFALGYLDPAVMHPVEESTPDPIGRVFALLDQYRNGMVKHGCRMGCPMGNLALEVSDGNPKARRLIHQNFENWSRRVEGWLVAAGDKLPPDVDRAQLARFTLTVMEGGVMQARAADDLAPFDQSVAVLRTHFDLLIATAAGRSRAKRPTAKGRRRASKTK